MSRKSAISAVPASRVLVDPRLLNIEQTAAYLGCTETFARSLAWSRACKFLRLGKRILFDKSDLDLFVEQQKAAQ